MKIEFIFFVILLFQTLLLDESLFSQDYHEMKINKIDSDVIVANKGKNHGVLENSIYDIIRLISSNRKIIGKAKVLIVKDNISGLKIIEMLPGYNIDISDALVLNLKYSIEEKEVINELQKMENQTKSNNFFNKSKYRTPKLVGRWGMFFSWAATVAGSSAMGDEMFATTIIPVVGPFVTIYRIESNPNYYYLPGGQGLLLTSGFIQTFFASYYIYYLIKDSNYQDRYGLFIEPMQLAFGLKLTYKF